MCFYIVLNVATNKKNNEENLTVVNLIKKYENKF
jgi:hypothetical protein